MFFVTRTQVRRAVKLVVGPLTTTTVKLTMSVVPLATQLKLKEFLALTVVEPWTRVTLRSEIGKEEETYMYM